MAGPSRPSASHYPTISIREQAEAFRTIALYLQNYASSPVLPVYSKTGSISLTQIGWGRSYTGGFALRPVFLNAGAVQRTLAKYVEDLHCKPPFHPDGLVPMRFVSPSFHAVEPVTLTFEQRFHRRRLCQVWHRQGDLDSVSIPPAPN